MTTTIRGLATRVDIAVEYLPDIPIALLTRAEEAVASTFAPHGLAAGAIGHFIASRGDIDGQAAIVAAPDATSWTCAQLNTSLMRQFPLDLMFRPAGRWEALLEATRFAFDEGERQALDATHIDMQRRRQRAGTPEATTCTFGVAPQTKLGTAMAALQAIADANATALFRIVLHDGALIVFRGQPTRAPGVDVSSGLLATGSFGVLVHGTVVRQRDVPTPTYIEIDFGAAVVEIEF